MSKSDLCRLCQENLAINVGLKVESLVESSSRKLIQSLFRSYQIEVSLLKERSSICKQCYKCILQISQALEKWGKAQKVLKTNPMGIADSNALKVQPPLPQILEDPLLTDDGTSIKEEELNILDMELVEETILNSPQTLDFTAPPPPNRSIQRTETNILENIQKSVERMNSEMTSLKSEVASIKSKVFGDIVKSKNILPSEPFTTMDKFKIFESELKDDDIFKTVVNELSMCSGKSFEKYIRTCWRELITDEVARQCSWRGTESKLCVRGMLVTSAVRVAFKQRFGLDDSDFDRITQKYFQYANDRATKLSNKKIKI